METNEIIKALRVCGGTGRCVECPLGDKLSGCMKSVMTEAAGLIERQDVEIRALRGAAGSLKAALEDAQKSIEVFGQANAALRDKVPEWIPVKERLPEIGVKVLTLDKRGHIRDRVYKSYTNGKPYFYPDGLEPGRDIKAWMPVPEEAEHGEIRKS